MAENQYGTDGDSGFNALSKAYKNDPSIENYLKLRREHPDGEIEVGVIGGLEQLFYMEAELRKFGIDPNLMAGALDADQASINELSLQLMEKTIEARRLAQAGETQLIRRGLAIPDKLINWIITCSLDAMSWSDNLEIPRDLIVLIRERLGGTNLEYEQASRANQQKMRAAFIAGQLKARGITPTLKTLGHTLGVAPSTVKRWFEDGELERETERWSCMFDQHGNLVPFKKSVEGRGIATKR